MTQPPHVEPLGISRAGIMTPGPELDHTYTARCDCGWYRDFGYMAITCDRETEYHRERGPDHDILITATEAPPLTRQMLIDNLRKSKVAGAAMGKLRGSGSLTFSEGF
jgi:hypothetical protein